MHDFITYLITPQLAKKQRSGWALSTAPNTVRFVFLFFLLVGVFPPKNPAVAQFAEVSQRVLPIAELYDLDFVARFLEEQFIVPIDPEYNLAVFLDVTRDGFGTNDLLILYPSEEYFQLSEYLPDQMVNTLSEQNLETDYNLSTSRNLTSVIAEEAETEEDPKKALAGALLGSLITYLPSGDFEGYINQRGEDVRISFWGYDDDSWQFIPDATQCIQPNTDPTIVVVHKIPQIQSFLDVDGCVVVQTQTTGGDVTSRVCE